MDIVDTVTRSRMMAGIGGKDTQPEITLRKGLFERGFRYRVNYKGLPGRPDIVLSKFKAVIFVNGCFWHGHDCELFRLPKTRTEFWRKKIETTRLRDSKNIADCHSLDLRTLVVWECALKGKGRYPVDQVIEKIAHWLVHNHTCSSFEGRSI